MMPMRPVRRKGDPRRLLVWPAVAVVVALVFVFSRRAEAPEEDGTLTSAPPPSAGHPESLETLDGEDVAAPPSAARVAFGPGAPADDGDALTYVVQEGDSLASIAQAHGTTVEALREANGLEGDALTVGDVLALPEPTRPAGQDGVPAGHYEIQEGDTMWGIARAFGISLDDLLAANPDVEPEKIRPGDVIRIPPAE